MTTTTTTTTTPLLDPTTIVTWNCNGFVPRCKNNVADLRRLLDETDHPDCLCLQEARLKAQSSVQRDTPLPSEWMQVESVVTTVFRDYVPYWSLADKRQAGTLTLLHKRLFLEATPNREDTQNHQHHHHHHNNNMVAYSPQSAIANMLQRRGLTREKVGLPPEAPVTLEDVSSVPRPPKASQPNKTSPAMILASSKGPVQKKQKSMMSFFATKPALVARTKTTKSTTTTVTTTVTTTTTTTTTTSTMAPSPPPPVLTPPRHTVEGRFQYFSFPTMDLLQTYVPNHGSRPDQYERRRVWDQRLSTFLTERRAILAHDGSVERTLLWTGDLNCGATYRDGTHWQKRTNNHNNKSRDSIREWWTDEAKCLSARATKPKENVLPPPPQQRPTAVVGDVASQSSDTVGMSGFTPGERRRFQQLQRDGQLMDVWRTLHPHGVDDTRTTNRTLSRWEQPNWTWRGTPSKGNYKSFYEGKAMRLDYFLLSSTAMELVERCDILGYGTRCEGLFCGSDHCATMLTLKQKESKNERDPSE